MQRPGGVFFSFGKHPVDRIGLQHFQDNDGRKVIIRPSNQPKLSKRGAMYQVFPVIVIVLSAMFNL